MDNDEQALDSAQEKLLAGDREGAMKIATALLEQDEARLDAAWLLTEALASDRAMVAVDAARRLVDAYTRRGDLPMAIVGARAAGAAGADVEVLHAELAEVFGKGSARVADVAPAPPPLPGAAPALDELAKLAGDALLDRAEQALESFLMFEDPVAERAKVPALPLFGALEAEPLAKLMAAFEVKSYGRGAEVFSAGERGNHAYVVVRGQLEVVRGAGEDETLLAVLGPGAIFGEMALVSDAPRAAGVRAKEPTILLVVARDALESVAKDAPVVGTELSGFCRNRMVSNLMRHGALLRSVDPAKRPELMRRFKTRYVEAGEVLLEEGSESAGLFLIASGAVEVLSQDADGDQIRVAELGPGDVVGEISLVLRRPANATVRAIHRTVALELLREEFQEILREHPTLLGELYQTATERDEETRSVVAMEALDVEDVVLL